MAAENREWAFSPLPLIAIVLVAAGVLVKSVSLESARPTDVERKTTIQLGRQDVPARLWQDPFAAIGRRAVHGDKPSERDRAQAEDKAHAPGELIAQVKEALVGGEVRVLAVMVFGGTYAEDSEHRRRTRYAVVSGLGVSGYAPQDAEAIGYVWTGEKHATTSVEARLPSIVPYEWFAARNDDAHSANGGSDRRPREKILLLWLEDGAFDPGVVPKLTRLVKTIVCAPGGKCPITEQEPLLVIGPAGSGTLKVLVREIREDSKSDPDGQTYLRFYSAFATLPDAELGYGANHPLRTRGKWREHVSILRTIGADDALAAALIDELSLRNVNRRAPCKDGMVIVSEWDTEYARGQKALMERALRAHCGEHTPSVTWFSYLRGLDGALPDPGRGSGTEQQGNGKADKGQTKEDVLAATVARERVEGRSQYDYLRRIGDRVEAFDREERRHGRGGVRAVGVLGSDVYDKLLVLQALRPRFPDAIFFTTDLDVRLAHPDQSQWARNLVVASHFGLALNPGLQREVPPFRDAYQTATFLATRLALQPLPEGGLRELKGRLKKWIDGNGPGEDNGNGARERPFGGKRIYEIGRTGPVEVAASGAELRCDYLDGSCENIHDLRERSYPTLPLEAKFNALLVMLAVAGVALLAALTSRHVQAAVGAWWRSPYRLRIAIVILLGALGATWLWRSIVASIRAGLGEPFLWLEGVSIWPTQILYLAASVASAWFLWRGWSWLGQALKQIETEFHLPSQGSTSESRRTLAELFAVWFLGPLRSFPLDQIQSANISPYTGKPKIDVTKLWTLYRQRYTFVEMAPWVVITSGSFFVFAVALFLFDPPFFPHRGDLARWTNEVLVVLSVTLFILLLVSVIYITRTCGVFIVALAESHSDWPEASCRQSVRLIGVPREFADDWMDFNLIVRLTGVVDRLIYCPFIVLLLLVVVRSNLFDALDFPLPAAAVALVLVAYAVFCAAYLRRAAGKARTIALRNYDDEIMALKGDPALVRRELGGPVAEAVEAAASGVDRQAIAAQLERLRRRVEETREGAFLPLSQTPVVRALLIPFGGLGGVSLIDWLTIARL